MPVFQIRDEKPGDAEAVRHVNDAAFGQPIEGRIVDAIRLCGHRTISLVALSEGLVIGHLLLSPVSIRGSAKTVTGMGLGPMSVLPDYQNQGAGSVLVEEAVNRAKKMSVPFIVVLGHPEYYPRFGFKPASRRGIVCKWENVPDDAFMILVLDEPAMEGISGQAEYLEEFDSAA